MFVEEDLTIRDQNYSKPPVINKPKDVTLVVPHLVVSEQPNAVSALLTGSKKDIFNIDTRKFRKKILKKSIDSKQKTFNDKGEIRTGSLESSAENSGEDCEEYCIDMCCDTQCCSCLLFCIN